MKSLTVDEMRTKTLVKCLMISFTQVMLDKHGMSQKEVVEALKEIDYTWDSIRTGRLNVNDIEHTLDEEYDIQFE